MNKKIKSFEPENFELELNTVWGFPDRGSWATHDAKYRGNWSPYIPRNLILRYTKEQDLILDQFIGGGTTLVEAKLLNRNIIGIDINQNSLEICKEKIDFEYKSNSNISLRNADARDLSFLKNESIDFICTHPPYANIIKYSEDIDGDLSHLELKDFLVEIKKVAEESYRVLKKSKFCAILIGDTRKNGNVMPLGFETMKVFQEVGFKLKEIILKEQHNCRATGFWKTRSIKYNFLLLAHEYLFVFRK